MYCGASQYACSQCIVQRYKPLICQEEEKGPICNRDLCVWRCETRVKHAVCTLMVMRDKGSFLSPAGDQFIR